MAVLLVEDDTVVRLTLGEFLEDAGLQIIEAGNARAAMEILADPSSRISILVTDLNLGSGDDGLMLAAKARASLPDLQVVYATGSPDRLAGRRLALWEKVFIKPFDPAVLAAVVSQLNARLDQRRPALAAAVAH